MVELLFIGKVFISGQVMFDAVGGLNKQIRALKEMVLFPLMYPEVFEKFKISPPRGVLFHGPPGKTAFVLFLLIYKLICIFIIHKIRNIKRRNNINSENKTEFQMGFEPTTLCDLVGCSNH